MSRKIFWSKYHPKKWILKMLNSEMRCARIKSIKRNVIFSHQKFKGETIFISTKFRWFVKRCHSVCHYSIPSQMLSIKWCPFYFRQTSISEVRRSTFYWHHYNLIFFHFFFFFDSTFVTTKGTRKLSIVFVCTRNFSFVRSFCHDF